MINLNNILVDKTNYKNISKEELNSKKGFYYVPNFTQHSLSSLQGNFNDKGSYSLIIFQNNDKIEEPVVLPQIPTTPVKITGDEISIDAYDKLSQHEKTKYYAVHSGNQHDGFELIKYNKIQTAAVKPGKISKLVFKSLPENDKKAYYYDDTDGFYYLSNTITDDTYNLLSQEIKQKYNSKIENVQSGSSYVPRHRIQTTGGRRKEKNTRKSRKNRRKQRKTRSRR